MGWLNFWWFEVVRLGCVATVVAWLVTGPGIAWARLCSGYGSVLNWCWHLCVTELSWLILIRLSNHQSWDIWVITPLPHVVITL